MSSFFWNVRILNKSNKYFIIQNWINNGIMQFGCLLETRVKENKAPNLISTVFRDWSVLSNYEYGRLGRIWVLWKENVRVTPMFKSGKMVTCSILLEGREEEFLYSFVYASNTVDERKELWADMMGHQDSPLFQKKPWMICGNFNEVLAGHEHSNYNHSPISSRECEIFKM